MIKENILVEPARRETGPAHGLGALYISKIDPEAVIITESADRLVKPIERYLEILQSSAKVSFEKKIMIAMGVKPRYANPGYGHIKRGTKWGEVDGATFFKLEKFFKNLPLDLAEKNPNSGENSWNPGQFACRADT